MWIERYVAENYITTRRFVDRRTVRHLYDMTVALHVLYMVLCFSPMQYSKCSHSVFVTRSSYLLRSILPLLRVTETSLSPPSYSLSFVDHSRRPYLAGIQCAVAHDAFQLRDSPLSSGTNRP